MMPDGKVRLVKMQKDHPVATNGRSGISGLTGGSKSCKSATEVECAFCLVLTHVTSVAQNSKSNLYFLALLRCPGAFSKGPSRQT